MEFMINKNYKYGVEILSADSEEFKRVKEFFDDCRYKNDICYYKFTVQNFQIFKVNENNSVGTLNEKRNNLMLFHGTKEYNVHSILKNGFKNSENGLYGKVV